MFPLSAATKSFIRENRTKDVRTLALQAGKYPGVDVPEAVAQIAGWQAVAAKVPSWADADDLYFPPHLSLEQCSSEATARYKSSLAKGDSMADLTGGFGVDCVFLSAGFRTATYVERNELLCRIAAHNFPLLGAAHLNVVHAEAAVHLQSMPPVDCIYIDPARRDGKGGKTVAIADCEPDVARLEPLLIEKARRVLVKLSPMLDVAQALRELPHTQALHVVAVEGECKELLAVLGAASPPEVPIHCINLLRDGTVASDFVFTREGERACACSYAPALSRYLYEPNAAVLKAGAYKSVATAYGLCKLHPNTHLYTSDKRVDSFPGRVFRVVAEGSFGKKELKSVLSGLKKANLSVRNFPEPVAMLRKRLKLAEGGDTYLFATTLADGGHRLVRCEKPQRPATAL